ncbi:hypothetical protein BUALT_Bualt03G0159900 [Buddleja alternifolia]|uniref:ALA-interacting subunit n=1 Tax=Buddleja alternifolia TaxID=168488 RepID=A0AAV6XV46_9LAMI|nr:hypothetical protein BUALT_Bualt03G0159900 [Buddleja alternifolia]
MRGFRGEISVCIVHEFELQASFQFLVMAWEMKKDKIVLKIDCRDLVIVRTVNQAGHALSKQAACCLHKDRDSDPHCCLGEQPPSVDGGESGCTRYGALKEIDKGTLPIAKKIEVHGGEGVTAHRDLAVERQKSLREEGENRDLSIAASMYVYIYIYIYIYISVFPDLNWSFSELCSSDSRFTQQELPACKPILTPKWVISTFLLVSVIFIPIGVVSLFASRDVVEIVDRYETDCIPVDSRNNRVGFIQSSQDKTCNRTLRVPKHMRQPIYVYYQLDNFYQNHRRYVRSRSDQQLRSPGSNRDTSACSPEDTTPDGTPIVPCGLIAWSLFNDTYGFTRNNQQLIINKRDIAWSSDRDRKFGDNVFPSNFQNGTLQGGARLNTSIPLSEQEDLIVWMRTAALPTFRKLYGKIEVDLRAGETIDVTLQNNYNTYSFNGKKKLVLSTTTWLGGKNDFVGIAYLTVGGLCFFLAIVFTLIYLIKPRYFSLGCSFYSCTSYK